MKSTNFYVPVTTVRLIFIENWEEENELKEEEIKFSNLLSDLEINLGIPNWVTYNLNFQ